MSQLRVVRDRVASAQWQLVVSRGRQARRYSVFPSADALEQQCRASIRPRPELVLEPRCGTAERKLLAHELKKLLRAQPVVPITVGVETFAGGDECTQAIPFQHSRAAATFSHAITDTVWRAMRVAAQEQARWERTSLDERCDLLERTADIIAGERRQAVVAAAMVGQAMTAIQAELNVCQLVDYLRYNCMFMRDLTRSRCVVDGGRDAFNRNQYHGLEGFWAAITPCDSLSQAAQLALTPLIMGNCVVWKPSDHAVLACHRVFECAQKAGLPPGVLNFVPAEENAFLELVCSNPGLAGIAFAGTTRTLERIYKTVGSQISKYARFPRIVGTGSGKNFHVVHSSASIPTAVACTVRAAFEMAGQKSMSCSRVFVAKSVLGEFLEQLQAATRTLYVSSPLDYRCFTSALVSREAYDKVAGVMERAPLGGGARLVCGGQRDSRVGYFVQPTVYEVREAAHELLTREARGPLLPVCAFADDDPPHLLLALSHAPYALTGSIFAQDLEWSKWALSELRDFSTTLSLNERCSEERPAQQSVGGSRKSGTGAKAGSISYLLHFGTERSVREALAPCSAVTYSYMDEVAPPSAHVRFDHVPTSPDSSGLTPGATTA